MDRTGINNNTELSFEFLRNEIIGSNYVYETPYGNRMITYADYTASGKTLGFIEKYLIELQKCYANTHTDDDVTGAIMTAVLHKSVEIIKTELNAKENCFVIPVGNGATGAVTKLSQILGLYIPPATKKLIQNQIDSERDDFFSVLKKSMPVVFVGPYEHHSNILLWIEGLAEVVEIELNDEGLLDLHDLKSKLTDERYKNRKKIGSFSAASNITGVITPVYEVAKILHENNAIACFDFAASGPYVEIDMNKNTESYFDAVFFSPHKFIGGPGSSGILVINKNLYDTSIPPTVAGGGTVEYVSSLSQDYLKDVEEREKAGTPGILQTIKASLAIELKGKLGIKQIEEKEKQYTDITIERLEKNPNILVIGPSNPRMRISIISFLIKHKNGYLHHKFVSKLFNDLFGIQSRAGCSCAGPYGHRLLNLGPDKSEKYREAVLEGWEALKPGWVRINMHYVMSMDEINFILDAVDFIADYGYLFLNDYIVDIKDGSWSHKDYDVIYKTCENFGILKSIDYCNDDVFSKEVLNKNLLYKQYLDEANKAKDKLLLEHDDLNLKNIEDKQVSDLNWFYYINQKS